MTIRTRLPLDPQIRRGPHLAWLSRQLLIFRAMLLLFVLFSAKAEATSLEMRAGGGDIETMSTSRYNAFVQGSYKRADGLLLFNAGERADLFIGAEYDRSHEALQHFNRDPLHTNPERYYQYVPYSLQIRAASLGIRIKAAMAENWYFYVAPGLIAGRAAYRADLTAQPLVLLTSNEGVSRFIGGRLGVGAVVDLSEQIAIGIEATFTQSSPAFTIWVKDTTTNQVESRRINNKADMIGLMIGLHYNLKDY